MNEIKMGIGTDPRVNHRDHPVCPNPMCVRNNAGVVISINTRGAFAEHGHSQLDVMELTDAKTKLYLIGVAYLIQLVNGDARIPRADISAVLGERVDPNFWPVRGRRNSLEPKFKQYIERKYNTNTLHGRYEKPLYVDEPMWLTIDRRADGDDDYFWVSRGRRGSSWKHPTAVRFPLNTNDRYRNESDDKIK